MSSPLISVIMGIFNCESTLEESILCILNQTYDNYEVILCDDGSNDNTYFIAEKFLKLFPDKFVLLKNEKNMGLNFTLNKCLAVAKGDYIARMDGDDICPIDRFQKEIDFLINNPKFSFVSCDMELFDSSGPFRIVSHKPVPSRKDLIKKSQFCHAGCMIKTDAFRSVDGYSDSDNCIRVEDYDLWVRLYYNGYEGFNINQVLYSMRDDRNAFNRRNFKNRLNESLVKFRACKLFKMPLFYYFFCLVPIFKYFTPNFIYKFLHKI